jgi:hypothetical protein
VPANGIGVSRGLCGFEVFAALKPTYVLNRVKEAINRPSRRGAHWIREALTVSRLLRAVLGNRHSEGLSMTPDAQFERLSANLRRSVSAKTPSSTEKKSTQPKKPRKQLTQAAPHHS